MKKILSLIIAVAVLIAIIPTQSVEAAIKISKTKATMEVDSTLTLKLSGTKSNALWTSSKPSIASVNSKGLVTAKKSGQTTVSAKIGKVQYSCIVKVVNTNSKAITANKGTVTELSTGKYIVGEDFPSGKYDMKVISGQGNFQVSGNDTYVNEVVAEKGSEFFDTHSYKNLRLLYGDEINITMGVVLEFTKLD